MKYKEWVLDSFRSIVAILEDLPSLKPPLDHLCELLPRLHPRYYSISSSPKVYPTSVHVTAVIVHYETPTKRITKGVATNCFKELHTKQQALTNGVYEKENGSQIPSRFPIYIRKSPFLLPFKFQTPIVMIGEHLRCSFIHYRSPVWFVRRSGHGSRPLPWIHPRASSLQNTG